jgi:hypothetical protein
VLKLLLGLRNPRTLAYLTAHGFTKEDQEEGWRLLRSQAKVAIDKPPAGNVDPDQIAKLDAWENFWFPIVSATLQRRFPEVHEKVFLNLSQTEGPAVIISVGTLVERVTALRDGDEQSRRAAQTLAQRGLTNAVLDQARALLAELGLPTGEAPVPDLKTVRNDALLAEAELWSWYLEWGQIARAVIPDRRLLRELGFLRPVGSASGEEGAEGEEEELEEVPLLDPPPVAPPAGGNGTRPAPAKVGMPGSNPFTE